MSQWKPFVIVVVAALFVVDVQSAQLGIKSAEQERAEISQLAASRVSTVYSQMKPAWFDQFAAIGNCDHLLNHPDFYSCMGAVGAWINHRQNPQMFGPVVGPTLLSGVSTRVENVTITGSTARALVAVSGTCKLNDDSHFCVSTGARPNQPFQTKVIVTLNGTGLLSKTWQIAKLDEDPATVAARQQRLSSERAAAANQQQRAQRFEELFNALRKNDMAEAKRVLDRGGLDVNRPIDGLSSGTGFLYSSESDTLLYTSVVLRNLQAVQLLLQYGADANRGRDSNVGAPMRLMKTPLATVVSRATVPVAEANDIAIIKALVGNHADISEAKYQADDCLKNASEAIAEFKARGDLWLGHVPEENAKYKNCQDVLELLALGGNPKQGKPIVYGTVPASPKEINDSMMYGRTAEIQKMLRSGLGPNFVIDDYHTLLGVAAYWGQMEIVRLLLSSGADPNLTPKGGPSYSPLRLALLQNHPDVAEVLRAAGAK